MNRLRQKIIAAFVILFSFTMVMQAGIVHANYNSSNLISDSLFRDANSMNSTDIQNFLVAKGSGLASRYDVEDCGNPAGSHYSYYATYYSCGQSVLASKIIADAARAYGISPKVILATLQKEQSLITTPNPTSSQINCAMGYYSCSGYVGFFSQVDNGTWQFRTYVELMNGNNWWGYGPSSYPCKNGGSLYSDGLYPGRTVIFANPGGAARTVTIANSATAALYCYTPHVGPYSETGYSGSYNFVVWFEAWFGSVQGSCYGSQNLPGVSPGNRVMANRYSPGATDNLTMVQLNATGSQCIEAHTWKPYYQSWLTNVATNMPAVDPNGSQVLHADTDGNGVDELIYVQYTGTGSGKIEVHTWKPGYQTWSSNIPTNLPSAPIDHGQIIAGRVDGSGRDSLMYVQYTGTGSGKIEVHTWRPGYQSWVSNIPTNVSAAPPDHGQITTGNVDGSGIDSLLYVQYMGTGSGKVEVHTWRPGYQSWVSNIPTNLSAAPPEHGEVITGAVNGNGRDQLIYVQYQGTGSGKVEIHTWNPGYQNFQTDIVSNLGQF